MEVLILATPEDQLVPSVKPRKPKGVSAEPLARLEHEMETRQRDFKAVAKSHGQNVLSLTVARSFIRKLLENAELKQFLNAQYAGVLHELTALVGIEAL